MKTALSWVIISIALLVSGNATFEVLTSTVGIQLYIALAAAIVIDAAAIWMGWHAITLAKLNASTKAATLTTWFIITISLAVNFFHGFTEGALAGGLVGIIFPLLAALVYEHFIQHTIYEVKLARGEILPRKPHWIKGGKYGDKREDKALEQDFVSFTRDRARHEMSKLRDSLVLPVSYETAQQDTEIDLPLEDETNETSPVLHETSNETTAGLAEQVDNVFAAQMLRDVNETMTIKQIIEVLVEQGIQDYKELQDTVSRVKGQPVQIGTIRKTASRVIQDNKTGE